MLKVNQLFYKVLQVTMLILSIHWFLVSLFGFPAMVLSLILGLGFFYLKPSWFKVCYDFVVSHKFALLALAIFFQIALLLSARLLIRSDAAVVFQGAIKELAPMSISSYLTRNPNNLALFLYERFFYRLFTDNALWVLQAINIGCANVTAYVIYRTGRDFFSQEVADVGFLFYLFFLGFSPYFMAMYTDILGLPLLALELYLSCQLLKQKAFRWSSVCWLGVVTGIALLWRSTALITIVAMVMVLFFMREYQRLLKTLLIFSMSFGLVYGGITMLANQQDQVVLLKGEGLAKPVLNFVNLGLTYSGTDQTDMKEGLLKYLPKEKRGDYNNGMFKKEYVIKEIKRRWSEYTWSGFMAHLAYKQTRTVNDGTLGWLYQSPKKEKTVYISPLYQRLKDQSWTRWVRESFIDRDGATYYYFAMVKQAGWILLAIGLCLACMKKNLLDTEKLLLLATFGGLLFLLIFEGGKGRYLIQFVPQIILLSALGWKSWDKKGVLK